MLTADQAQAVLDGFTYPLDGFTLRYYQGRWEGGHVVIRWRDDDNFNPGETIDLDVHTFVSPNDLADEEALKRWVGHRMARIAVHEMRERLRYRGEAIFDPHQPDADKDIPV